MGAKNFFIGILILAIILGGFYFITKYISATTGYVIRSDDSQTITSCFEEKGVIVYTSPNCPSCERQIRTLSEVIDGIGVVDCSLHPQSCLVLTQLPAMEYDNGLYYGYKEFEEIREIVQC